MGTNPSFLRLGQSSAHFLLYPYRSGGPAARLSQSRHLPCPAEPERFGIDSGFPFRPLPDRNSQRHLSRSQVRPHFHFSTGYFFSLSFSFSDITSDGSNSKRGIRLMSHGRAAFLPVRCEQCPNSRSGPLLFLCSRSKGVCTFDIFPFLLLFHRTG